MSNVVNRVDDLETGKSGIIQVEDNNKPLGKNDQNHALVGSNSPASSEKNTGNKDGK